MEYNVIEALNQIAAEKNMEIDYVIDTLKSSLVTAAKKKYGDGDNITVDKGTLVVGEDGDTAIGFGDGERPFGFQVDVFLVGCMVMLIQDDRAFCQNGCRITIAQNRDVAQSPFAGG